MANDENTPDTDLLVVFAPGDSIFNEGETGREMFIIESGSVEITKKHGSKQRRLALLAAGDFFGEMAVLEEMPRSASAQAQSECRLLPIDAATFDRLIHDHPKIVIRIMRKISSRLREHERENRRALKVAAGILAGVKRSDSVLEAVAPLPSEAMEEPAAPPQSEAPRLVHSPSGKEFPLSEGCKLILGRKDPASGFEPDIDLEPLDEKRSLSRNHAVISERGGRYFVREDRPSSNGTWVGHNRLEPGEEREIFEGDYLRLGIVELRVNGEMGG